MMFRPSTVSTNNGRYLPNLPSFSGRNPTTVPSKARLKSYRKTSRSTRGVSLSPPLPELIVSHAIMCSPSYLRSEEHTSELQSRENLVCRLLLEKKNDQPIERQPCI